MTKLLESKEDFEWYKVGLDAQRKYRHRHVGTPRQYPCMVKSVLRVDDSCSLGGRDEYYHTFIYKEIIICDNCGASKTQWPDGKAVEDLLDE